MGLFMIRECPDLYVKGPQIHCKVEFEVLFLKKTGLKWDSKNHDLAFGESPLVESTPLNVKVVGLSYKTWHNYNE
jgi:hypothetical protein